METIFATLACYLLLMPLAEVQTQGEKFMTPSPDSNMTHTAAATLPSANSTANSTAVISNSTANPTSFTTTTRDNEPSTNATAATPESTSPLHTSQATTSETQTNDTSPTTTTPGTPASTALITTQTIGGYITPDTIATESSSHTANTTSESIDRPTQGLGLNISEKNMTIVFSVVLGVFGLAVVVFMFHKCKHKIQYLHQPLHNAADDFVADDDTLVISGGLYDGHPIYDNVPTVPDDQSQFHLQFLH